MDFYHFVAAGMGYRGFALYHELAPHQYLGIVSIFMAVQQFSCNHAAEVFYLLDIPIDSLLKHLVDHFKIPRKVRPFETSREIDKDIKIGDKNDRAFLPP